MIKKIALLVFIFMIRINCFAQASLYSKCWEQNSKNQSAIMVKFHYYDKKRMDSTITRKENQDFQKVQFDLLISRFLYWGECGRMNINTDPFYNYFDSSMRGLKYFDRDKFEKRPEIAEKMKKRKPDSFYLKGPEVFSIPPEIAKKTRFGNLGIGKSIDLYYMKPLVIFYDTTWDQFLDFEIGEGVSKYPRGWRSIGPCIREPLKELKGDLYNRTFQECGDCQYEMFKHRLAKVYDISKEDIDRLAVKGKDMRYIMYRRVKITRESCYYTVQFYKDIFESDSQTQMLHWFVNKFKNKKSGNSYTPTWEKGFLLNSTLTEYAIRDFDYYYEWLNNYSRKLCILEEGKMGSKSLYLPKKFLKTPHLSNLWNDGVFLDAWQIMDFGDNNPVCRRFSEDGDIIMYRNPFYIDYHAMSDDYHYVKNDARPFYKSYNKKRRFLYYKILRYPEESIMYRIDDVTH